MRLTVPLLLLTLHVQSGSLAAAVQTPGEFFGIQLGADGQLAPYPRVVEYLQHLSRETSRVQFRELGRTTLDNPYVLAVFSSPENLARLPRLIEISNRLADPRGLSEEEARALSRQGRPFYFLYATIHSTEIGNGQAIIEIAHRMATSGEPEVEEILNNAVLLMVPSQNPDGQVLVIDHYNQTRETDLNRTYPDLYHHYTGHDDNRDWYMFTQKETLLNVEKVQNFYRPQITHDMHQMGSGGARIFVPPFIDPYDPNIHPILAEGQAQIGLAMASALVAEGKEGVSYFRRYDLWTPARQYMVYHGQPRILTEIASARLADPLFSDNDEPLGPQQVRWNFPRPYSRTDWRLRDIMDYGKTAVFAGLTHVAKYRETWLYNFYQVHRDWVQRAEPPYAFVIPASQRDPFETYELLRILEIGDVEIHRAREAFEAAGRRFSAGDWVIRLNQPYGAFAKTMLERQVYPDLRAFAGGPPIPPYDVTAHTLGFLMGVETVSIDEPLEASLERVAQVEPLKRDMPAPRWAFVVSPSSNAAFRAVTALQKAGVAVFRSASEFESAGVRWAQGSWLVPVSSESRSVLETVSRKTGLEVGGVDEPVEIAGFRLRDSTRVGLWKGANNMAAGWMKWLFEQYDVNHRTVASTDFDEDLNNRYDVLVLPAGTSRRTIVDGLDSGRNGEEWRWAFGVGSEGWRKLQAWVRGGGTLVALGSSVETARQLFDLPIEGVLPRRRGRGGETSDETSPVSSLQEAFQSPARLLEALQTQVVEASSLFFCPGSLLENEFDPTNPIAFGMPRRWPVFFRFDQAYRLKPGFDIPVAVVSRYPAEGPILASGWLLGEEKLRNLANTMSFEVGRGKVIALSSQMTFRTQPRATLKLLFNAIFQGPAVSLTALQLRRGIDDARSSE